jgi:hypothetical protein
MLQVFDSAAFEADLAIDDRLGVAFHQLNGVGTRDCLLAELNLWACVSPCRCYTQDVTILSVRLRASVFGYNFAVRLFHSQLQAGLSRRFLSFQLASSADRKLEAYATYLLPDANACRPSFRICSMHQPAPVSTDSWL